MKQQTAAKQSTNTPIVASSTGRLLQRKCACGQHTIGGSNCAACAKKEETLQRHAAHESAHEKPAVPESVHQVLGSAGHPLDVATRSFMESRFGHDFSHVRVHTDTQAAESARAVNALAYTVGNHVAFAAGRYAPNTNAGRQLVAHELSHVVQQSSGREGAGLKEKLAVSMPGDAAEREADRMAEAVIGGIGLGYETRAGALAATESETGFAGESATGAKPSAASVMLRSNVQLSRRSDGAGGGGGGGGRGSEDSGGALAGFNPCICAFKGSYGELRVDCGCRGTLALWVIDEGSAPAAGATCGTWIDADGFVLNGTTYKIDGSTCAEIKCEGGTPTISACVNNLASILGKRPPYPVPAGTFGGPPKEPAPGAAAPVVR